MVNLQLDVDEGIVLQAQEIERYGKTEDVIDELILTNKSLILIYEYKANRRAKAEQKIDKIPLEKIKSVNGKPQVMRINHEDYGEVMQVLYVDGSREYFMFWKPKKDIPLWISAISSTIAGEEVSITEESKREGLFLKNRKQETEEKEANDILQEALLYRQEQETEIEKKRKELEYQKKAFEERMQREKGAIRERKKAEFSDGISTFTSGVMSVANSIKDSLEEVSKQIKEEVIETQEVQESFSKETVFCLYCGTKLNAEAKYCYNCGNPVRLDNPNTKEVGERKEEYVGKIFKCSNCGEIISQTMAVCPSCGIRITEPKIVSSVYEFKKQLDALEISRKRKRLLYNVVADPIDIKKLTLIRNFPIPNSVDDIIEFMALAVGNIDVSLSKNTMMNKLGSSLKTAETGVTISKTISDAWVAKLQQMYLKAEVAFPNDPAFLIIKKTYQDKMKELKIKI